MEATHSSGDEPFTIPRIIFGTSGLGNIYKALSQEEKTAIIAEAVQASDGPVFFDTAGKYGAGLALESMGAGLHTLKIDPDNVLISNKLGWLRVPLTTPEPTFEPGVWVDLQHDAVQKISYDGIMECFEQGNQLLNGYDPQFVSVHDPDEYLASATNESDKQKRYGDILDAYRALSDLKRQGKARAIGVGAKTWETIRTITADVQLDWVMFANSLTIYHHPPELIRFIGELDKQGVWVINSAVFNGGFLTGSDYFNYRLLNRSNPSDNQLYQWRDEFYEICNTLHVLPAEACVQFVFKIPGVRSIALSSTSAKRTASNAALAEAKLPDAFWAEMKEKGLIRLGEGF